MSAGDWFVLILVGTLTGAVGSVGGLASLVSYPSLLALGLSPLAANVTGKTAVTALLPSAVITARRELRGHRRRACVLCLIGAAGGLAGALALLAVPHALFDFLVPGLVAFGSVLVLVRDRIRAHGARRSAGRSAMATNRSRWAFGFAVLLTSVYTGYFGAASAVIVFGLLSLRYHDSLFVVNSLKTLTVSSSNIAAMVTYVAAAPIQWPVVLPMGVGVSLGGWLGGSLLKRLPEVVVCRAIGLAGLALALALAWRR